MNACKTASNRERAILFDVVSLKYQTCARGLQVLHLKLLFVFLGNIVDMLTRQKYPATDKWGAESYHTANRKVETTRNITTVDIRVTV